MKALLLNPWVGKIVNKIDAASGKVKCFKVRSVGRGYDCFPGGQGVKDCELDLLSDMPLARKQIAELQCSVSSNNVE